MNNELILISKNNVGNNLTKTINEEKLVTIFCTVKSVWSKEFYASATSGLKPSIVFEIYPFEYNSETEVEHMKQRYTVIRVDHSPKNNKLELICERKGRNVRN